MKGVTAMLLRVLTWVHSKWVEPTRLRKSLRHASQRILPLRAWHSFNRRLPKSGTPTRFEHTLLTFRLLCLLLFASLASGCGPSQEDLDARVAAAAATVVAAAPRPRPRHTRPTRRCLRRRRLFLPPARCGLPRSSKLRRSWNSIVSISTPTDRRAWW